MSSPCPQGERHAEALRELQRRMDSVEDDIKAIRESLHKLVIQISVRAATLDAGSRIWVGVIAGAATVTGIIVSKLLG